MIFQAFIAAGPFKTGLIIIRGQILLHVYGSVGPGGSYFRQRGVYGDCGIIQQILESRTSAEGRGCGQQGGYC